MKARGKDQLPANRTIFGRVLDPQKRPVAGAAVTISGITIGGGTAYGALPERGDEVAVTDATGEFEICVGKTFDSAGLQIDAPVQLIHFGEGHAAAMMPPGQGGTMGRT